MTTDLRPKYRVVSIDPKVAAHVRSHLVDPQYGHPANESLATGYGPCRSCLRKFEVGRDHRLLFTYNPFEGIDRFPEPGPVFIHKHECEPYNADTFPPELRDLDYTLEAYAYGPELIKLERVAGGNIDDSLGLLLADPDVDYVHVRNTEAGCFDLRVERLAKC